MNNFNIRSIVLLFVLLIFSLGIFSCRQKAGRFAPDFELPLSNGGSLALRNYQGKVVLINFWATWCAPCRTEIPLFNLLYSKYKANGLIIIGVSIDKKWESINSFTRAYKMEYPVVMGDRKIQKIYKVTGVPESFLINTDGEIVESYIGSPQESVLEKDILDALSHQKK